MTTPTKQQVWIRWGQTEPTEPHGYEFATLEELNAFLYGVDEAAGWLDFEAFDTEEEARAAVDIEVFAASESDETDE